MYSLRQKDVDDIRPTSSHGVVRTENCLEKTGFLFTPLESSSISACRQTGMLGMVEIERISSLLRAGSKSYPF